jgi:hypothetical protein
MGFKEHASILDFIKHVLASARHLVEIMRRQNNFEK